MWTSNLCQLLAQHAHPRLRRPKPRPQPSRSPDSSFERSPLHAYASCRPTPPFVPYAAIGLLSATLPSRRLPTRTGLARLSAGLLLFPDSRSEKARYLELRLSHTSVGAGGSSLSLLLCPGWSSASCAPGLSYLSLPGHLSSSAPSMITFIQPTSRHQTQKRYCIPLSGRPQDLRVPCPGQCHFGAPRLGSLCLTVGAI
ncbi:hypothetical protein GY45DRAFT_710938 [Cubamyces sp. BRFM 1775]|nr:hypothetical protein GY45DRAFT_710938 [Cubamyces sp. BRFM 1775]